MYDKYGAGAESKIRMEEAKHVNVGYREIPISEGRMRISEQTRYNARNDTTNSQHLNEFDVRHSKSMPEKKTLTNQLEKIKPKNPFDEDDDNTIDYDESKNPFADDDVDGAIEITTTDVAKESSNTDATSNPFGEYDNNLNPFE